MELEDNGDTETVKDMPAAARPSLARAYERAIYRVDAPAGQIELKVGRRSVALDCLLRESGHLRAAYLSAANPRSRPLSDEANRARHELLLLRISGTGIPFFAGESAAPDGEWREASLLVLGLPEEAACDLAREFGQAAWLAIELDRPPRLVWI